MRVNLGSGRERFEGFLNIDLYDSDADVMADICQLPLADDSVEEAKCIQVIEHIPYNKNHQLFSEMYRVLIKGGCIDVETPDIDVVCRKILEEGLTDQWVHALVGEYYRPHDKSRYEDWYMNAAAIHRNPWNEKRLRRFAEAAGFRVERQPWQESIYKCEENMYVRLYKD